MAEFWMMLPFAPSSSANGSIIQNSAIVMARNCGDVPAAVKLKRAAGGLTRRRFAAKVSALAAGFTSKGDEQPVR
jgi:hypothetical protein